MTRAKAKQLGTAQEGEPLLFPVPARPDAEIRVAPIDRPLWTGSKARLIQRYIRLFIMITHHGNYIDGFAGPQSVENRDDMWSAKLVLELEPKWLRRFYLCDVSRDQYRFLQDLKKAHVDRNITIKRADCNVWLPEIVKEIKPKEATFCLLDQRMFECHWSTVQSIARHKKAENKIEIFYFVPTGWWRRSVTALGDERVLKQWWGRSDLDAVRKLSAHGLKMAFVDRFKELGYKSVMPWPIYGKDGTVMYYMVHATDHPEAPGLMRRAYKNAVTPLDPPEQFGLKYAEK